MSNFQSNMLHPALIGI